MCLKAINNLIKVSLVNARNVLRLFSIKFAKYLQNFYHMQNFSFTTCETVNLRKLKKFRKISNLHRISLVLSIFRNPKVYQY